MVRSRWVKAVMATVVSAGMAWGQSGAPSSPQAPDDPTGRVITVNEAGKAPQKCLVVKVSVDDRGRKILQVQSLANGEVMTIVTEGAPVIGEAPTGGKARTLRTQIFHWGRDHTAPTAVCDNGCSSCQQLPVITSVPAKSGPVCTTCPPSGTSGAGPVVTNCDPCKSGSGSTTIIPDKWATPSKTTTTTVINLPAPKPAETKVAQPEPSHWDKWHESWGKGDKPKAPAVETAKAPEPARLPPPELPHVDKKKPDPLLSDPTQYVKKPLDEKLPSKGEVPPANLPKLPVGAESLGAGSRSITDSGAVTSAPYPEAAMPPVPAGAPARPPMPRWNVPQAPQPVNPGRGYATESNQGGIAYNAFTPVEFTPPAPGTPAQGMMANAFSADTDPRPAAGVFGPAGAHPMPMPPAGYGPTNAMLPSSPYGPVVRMPAAPGANGPMGQGTQVAMLPRSNGVSQVGYQAPAASAPVAAGMSQQQLTGMLRDALYPSQREWAAEKLSSLNWKENDAAVQALARGVGGDACPTVRAACIHALARMKADSYAVVSAVQAAKKDADARVRTEAEEALSVLAPGAAAPAPLSPAVHPTAVVPPAPIGNPPLPPLSK